MVLGRKPNWRIRKIRSLLCHGLIRVAGQRSRRLSNPNSLKSIKTSGKYIPVRNHLSNFTIRNIKHHQKCIDCPRQLRINLKRRGGRVWQSALFAFQHLRFRNLSIRLIHHPAGSLYPTLIIQSRQDRWKARKQITNRRPSICSSILPASLCTYRLTPYTKDIPVFQILIFGLRPWIAFAFAFASSRNKPFSNMRNFINISSVPKASFNFKNPAYWAW